MKKSRHSEEKIIAAVKQIEGGRKTAEVDPRVGSQCRHAVCVEEQVRWHAGERRQTSAAVGG